MQKATPKTQDFAKWQTLTAKWIERHRITPFIIGDLLSYGMKQFGDAAMQTIPDKGHQPQTYLNYLNMAESIPANLRNMPNLTHAHYIEMARIGNKERIPEIIKKASQLKWDTRKLREIRAKENAHRST